MTSQKLQFLKLWHLLRYSESTWWRIPTCQKSIAIWGWDIGPFLLQWLHTNPCNFVLVLRVRTKTKLQGFVWSHWSKKGPISHPQIAIDFWQVGILHHVLSEYLSKSHNFKKNHFCDVTTSVLYWTACQQFRPPTLNPIEKTAPLLDAQLIFLNVERSSQLSTLFSTSVLLLLFCWQVVHFSFLPLVVSIIATSQANTG